MPGHSLAGRILVVEIRSRSLAARSLTGHNPVDRNPLGRILVAPTLAAPTQAVLIPVDRAKAVRHNGDIARRSVRRITSVRMTVPISTVTI